MLGSIDNYIHNLHTAWEQSNGERCGALLSLEDPHAHSHGIVSDNYRMKCSQQLPSPICELAVTHLDCLYALYSRKYIDGFEAQLQLLQLFIQLNNETPIAWVLSMMHSIVLNLRIISYKADKVLSAEKKTKPGLLLEKVIEQLRELFRACVQDNRQEGDTNRKSSILFLINQLFKIYFKINQLHLCVPLIRTVEKFNIDENVSKADHVTYLYFLGRKRILDGEFKGSVECMARAFVECDKSQFKNKQLILIYLIPLRILNGVMPTAALLEKYKLTQFSSLVEAVMTGNLKLFTHTTNSQQIFFIRSGIFLLVEKLRMIAYRNLFKRVWLLLGTSMLPIDAFVAALKMGESGEEGEEADVDQAHCIIANLIQSDLVRGYISQQHQKVVVSKQNPFPNIN